MKKTLICVLTIIPLILALVSIDAFAIVPDYSSKGLPTNTHNYPYFVVCYNNDSYGSAFCVYTDIPMQYDSSNGVVTKNFFVSGQQLTTRLQLYKWGGSSWTMLYDFTSPNGLNTCYLYIKEANYQIGSYQPYYTDYYITDGAHLYTEGGISSLLTMEKKWEKNLNMQFFIKTVQGDITNEVQELVNYGNGKSPSGNGSVTIYINKKTDGTFRLGLGISSRMGFSMPYADGEHNRAWTLLKQQVGSSAGGITSIVRMESFLEYLYKDLMYKPVDYTANGQNTNPLLFYHYWKNKRSMSDNDASTYILKSGKIPDVLNVGSVGGVIFSAPVDKYYWISGQYDWETKYADWQKPDLYHVWFGNVGSVTGGGPGTIEEPVGGEIPVQPPAGTGTEPTTPSAIVEPPGLGINTEPLKIDKLLPVAPLQQTMQRVNQLKDSSTPPAIYINLHELVDAGTKRFDSSVSSYFEDKNTIFVDFAYVDSIKFPGTEQKVIVWFKILISAAIYIYTAIALWHRFTPKEAVN